MRRLLHRPSRKKDDGEAANKHQSRRDLHYASTSQQHTTAPLPERPKPQATVATSRSQSLTGDKSSFLSSSPAPSSAEGRSQPSLTTSSGRAASTTAPQNLQHGRRQDGTASGGTAAKKDYWQFAVEKLQEKDSSVADQIVGVQEAATAAGNADFALQLLHMTEQGQQALEAKTWTIITGSRVLVLRDHFDRLVKAVTLFKDVGNATGSTDPLHTGLPLAGFCVLMQMATDDSDQYAAMVAGVEEIVTIMARYQQIEALYLSRPETALKQGFERRLVSLYKHIIRYQISATCYYRRNTMLRFLRAIPKLDDLSEVMAAVRQDDVACRNISRVFDSSDTLERHQELLDNLDRFQKYPTNPKDPDSTQLTTTMGSGYFAIHSVGERSTEYFKLRRIQLARQKSSHPHQTTLPSTRPHKCTDCGYCFTFTSSELNDLPYGASKKTIILGNVVHSAQRGCLFHQWLVDLIYLNIEGSDPRSTNYAEVEVSMSLQQIYQTDLIPHAFNQQEGRRLKWNARDRIQRNKTEPFIRYKYQAASSPYRVVISAQAVSAEGITVSGSDTLSFCRSDGHFQELMNGGSCISRTPMIEWNKGSQRSMNFAASRLSTCRQSHSECRRLNGSKQGQTSQPPTRLLDVKSASASGIIRLVQSAKIPSSVTETFENQLPVDYAILSYCWGGPQSLTLNSNTQEMLLGGIRVTRLGKTIQDAVRVCNELDIPYLWVDALCILQDNLDDQMRELSMMSAYYQDGVLTICAASAKSFTEGFLTSTEQNAYSAGPFKLTFEEGPRTLPTEKLEAGEFSMSKFSNKEIQRMAAHSNLDHVQLFKLHDDAPIEPIALRAWTFQEAILSTRLLIFASYQVYWCCRESYVGCGGIHSFERTSVVHPDCPGPQGKFCVCGVSLIRRITPPDLVPGVFTLGQSNTMSTDAQWDMVVTNFSGRALTFESDKLVAFFAVASYFDTLFRARWPLVQYAAGLWYSRENPLSFIRQLLWSSESPSTARRPESFRAPTWSWAGIDGEVKPFDRLQMCIHYHVSLTVVKVSTKLIISTILFGAIKSARLVVRCKLRDLALMSEKRNPVDNYPTKYLKTTPDTQDDETFIASNSDQVQLMEVIPYSARAASPIGLILRRFDSSDEASRGDVPRFKRLGMFCFSGGVTPDVAKGLFNGCTEEEICVL